MTDFAYGYFLKDHSTTVRMMLTEEVKSDTLTQLTYENVNSSIIQFLNFTMTHSSGGGQGKPRHNIYVFIHASCIKKNGCIEQLIRIISTRQKSNYERCAVCAWLF